MEQYTKIDRVITNKYFGEFILRVGNREELEKRWQ